MTDTELRRRGMSWHAWLARLLSIVFLAALVLFTARPWAWGSEPPARITGPVTIIDGDTLDRGAVRIRLHGIDAPEAGQRCGEVNGRGTWACGTAATNRLAGLVEVVCEARDRDRYGRVIAVCLADGQDINATLVEEGLAWAYLEYSDHYATHESNARSATAGIWQGDAQAPWDYRSDRWVRAAEAAPRPGCPIKGNINRDGERIYHTPWSPWYERTRIDESRGQRWFCDEAEAQEAGWRPARWR